MEAAGGYKTVAGAYFRGCGACIQYDPKVTVGAKTLGPKGDAYILWLLGVIIRKP